MSSGKSTARAGGHPSRVGKWLVKVELTDDRLSSLSNILERRLTGDETQRIIDLLTRTQCLMEVHHDRVSNQNVVATLNAIAKADGKAIAQAFADCDDTTELLIEQALYCDISVDVSGRHPPARIRAAALLALSSLEPGKDGPSPLGYRVMFAKSVLRLWRDLGRNDEGISELDGEATPIVQFARVLLEAVELDDCPTLSVVAKLLRGAREVIA